MEKRYIKCACCGNPIYAGDLCLQHEYGRMFCSYKCLVIEGFYGHYKKYKFEESKTDLGSDELTIYTED